MCHRRIVFFATPNKLPPGSFAVFDENGRARVAPYWSLIEIANQEPIAGKTEEEYLAELEIAVDRSRPPPVDGRRAAGGVSFRRHRFQPGRGADEGNWHRRRCALSPLAFALHSSMKASMPSKWRKHLGVENTLFMMDGSELLDVVARHGPLLRRADGRLFVAVHAGRFAVGPAARDGGAHRRWRRRVLRRIRRIFGDESFSRNMPA